MGGKKRKKKRRRGFILSLLMDASGIMNNNNEQKSQAVGSGLAPSGAWFVMIGPRRRHCRSFYRAGSVGMLC